MMHTHTFIPTSKVVYFIILASSKLGVSGNRNRKMSDGFHSFFYLSTQASRQAWRIKQLWPMTLRNSQSDAIEDKKGGIFQEGKVYVKGLNVADILQRTKTKGCKIWQWDHWTHGEGGRSFSPHPTHNTITPIITSGAIFEPSLISC